MKKYSLLFTVLLGLALVLAACGGDDDAVEGNNESEDVESNETTESEYEPEEINPDTDTCEVCGMAIADDEYATQIVLENDRVVKFDDLGDLYVWIEENGEDEIGSKFVRDFETEEWIQLEDATYVYDEEIETPMGFGVISFKDSDEAQNYIDENDHGELLSAEELNSHNWESEHGGHDDHDDHDDHDE